MPLSVIHVVAAAAVPGAVDLACEQRRRGSAVAAVCPAGSAVADQLAREGVEVEPLDVAAGASPDDDTIDHRKLGELTALFQRRRPDVVHSHGYTAHVHASLAAARAGVGGVVRTAATLTTHRRDPLVARRSGVHTIATSSMGAALLQAAGLPADRIRVVLPALSEPPLEPSRHHRRSDRPRIGCVMPQKGNEHLDVMADAMVHVLERRPDALLLLSGDGLDPSRVKKVAAYREVGRALEHLGPLDPRAALNQDFDLFVLPGASETFPMVLLEAMGAGLPVVATAGSCGVDDVIRQGETGWVVPRQPAELAHAIVELLDRPSDRDRVGAAARAHVLAHHHLAAMADRVAEVYAWASMRQPARPAGSAAVPARRSRRRVRS